MSDHTIIDGIDYGPLAALVGVWEGDKGMDVAPVPLGDEHIPYYETLVFEAAGNVTNAAQQTLSVLRYHQVVARKSSGETFHDQLGYWLWDAADDSIIETFIIPRGVAVVAGGTLAPPAHPDTELTYSVAATAGAADCGIVQAPFMFEQAKTTGFSHQMTVRGDTMRYSMTTLLDIYDRKSYAHTDENTLRRTA